MSAVSAGEPLSSARFFNRLSTEREEAICGMVEAAATQPAKKPTVSRCQCMMSAETTAGRRTRSARR